MPSSIVCMLCKGSRRQKADLLLRSKLCLDIKRGAVMRRSGHETSPPVSSKDSCDHLRIRHVVLWKSPSPPPVNISRMEAPQHLQAPVPVLGHYPGDGASLGAISALILCCAPLRTAGLWPTFSGSFDSWRQQTPPRFSRLSSHAWCSNHKQFCVPSLGSPIFVGMSFQGAPDCTQCSRCALTSARLKGLLPHFDWVGKDYLCSSVSSPS